MQKQHKPIIVYVFFGLIAGGKSTLASAWAKDQGLEYYNSDRVRKEIAGASGEKNISAFQQGIYSAEYMRKTYQYLQDKAVSSVNQGKSVVLDASYRKQADRTSLRLVVEKHGAQVRFILCSCPETELKRRMEERLKDSNAISDGRWEIYLQQKKLFERPVEVPAANFVTIQTMSSVSDLIDQLSKIFT